MVVDEDEPARTDFGDARGVEGCLAILLVERRRFDLLLRGQTLGDSVERRPYFGNPVRRCQPISTANRGLITSSMIASRSSNGMNADFIALMVKRARSVQP